MPPSPQSLQPTMTQQGQQQGPPPPDPNAAPPDPSQGDQGGGGAKPPGKMGKVFGGIGSFLKENSGAIADIGNQLAAAGGNYRPMMLAHQDREYQLQKSLNDSQLQNQELSRQLTRIQIANERTPEQKAKIASQQAGDTEAAIEANKTTIGTEAQPGGGYGAVRIQGTNAQPIMSHHQVPNPDRQVYSDVAAGGTPPNMVQDWNKGAPPTMPATVDEAHQMQVMPKGITKSAPLRQPDGSYAIAILDAGMHPIRYETLQGVPLQQVPIVTYDEKTSLHETPGGTVAATLPSSSTKGPPPATAPPPAGPLPVPQANAAPPPTQPAIPNAGGPTYNNPSASITGDQGPSAQAAAPTARPQARAAGAGTGAGTPQGTGAGTPPPRASLPPGVKVSAPIMHNSKEEDWVVWTDPKSGREIAGPNSLAIQLGAQNPAKIGQQEVRDISNARQAVHIMRKVGDPNKPETNGTLQLIDSLDKDGKLGVLASRWNNFMTKGIGTSPGDDPRIITLLDKNMLGDTATMLAHFGAAGGRSPAMLEHFLELAHAGRMDANTLRAGTKAVADYMFDKGKEPDQPAAPGASKSKSNHPSWFNQGEEP